MTPRRRRLWRDGLLAVAVVVVIAAGIALTERTRRPGDAPGAGIDDVLGRDMPPDTPPIRFLDATGRAGIAFRHFQGTRSHQLPEDMGSGLAWGDCDGDGLPDLYLVNFAGPLAPDADVQQGLAGNALYRNRGDGTFEEITSAAGVDLGGYGMGASWGDYDGDADLDLFVTRYGTNVLFRNEGGCRFVDVTDAAGVGGGDSFSAGATWGDHDGDGDLDLYVTSYVRFEPGEGLPAASTMQYGRAVPFTLNPASYEPAPNVLYRNEGDGRFTDVTSVAGVANATGRSLSAVWCDFDGDGDLDLYVANDISDNAFFRNRGDGRFEDVSTLSLTADYRGAMGLAVADHDRDGDLDFFVTHWIAQENALYDSHVVGARGLEELIFTDVADLVGLGATGLEYVGWGTAFIDYDNDGWKDLFVANGHTFEDATDPTRLLPQPMQLFWNRGPDGFFEVSRVAGPPLQRMVVARGAAAADYDGDGDVDLAVLIHNGPAMLLENSGTPGRHWIEIDLRQSGANAFGVGAHLRLETASGTQLHAVGAAPSYLSQDALTAHFGLGDEATVERLTVRWPDGEEETWPDLAADRRHVLRRGEARSGRAVGAGPVAAGAAGSAAAGEPAGAMAGEPGVPPEVRFWQRVREGRSALAAGARLEAIVSFEAALADRPDHGDTLHNLAQLRLGRFEIDRATALLVRLAEAEPSGARAWQQLSVVRGLPAPGWIPDLQAADAALDRALATNPEHSRSHLLRARWAAYRGDSAAARQSVELALGFDPRGLEAHVLAIRVALIEEDHEAARRAAQRARLALCDDGVPEGCPDHLPLRAALGAVTSMTRVSDPPPSPPSSDAGSVVEVSGSFRVRYSELSAEDAEALVRDLPLQAEVDLDGDGAIDLVASAERPEAAAWLSVDGQLLPHAGTRASGWTRQPGSRSAPWRGVFLDGGALLLMVGGGRAAVRGYANAGDGVWAEVPLSGLPERLAGAAVAVTDWDGDGRTDVFLGGVLCDPPRRPGSQPPSCATDVTTGAQGGVVSHLYRRTGWTTFEATAVGIAGGAGAALAIDADGDDDRDLLLARADDLARAAAGPISRRGETTGTPPDETAGASPIGPSSGASPLVLLRNDGGRAVIEASGVFSGDPALRAAVLDIAALHLDDDGRLDLWLARGGIWPEEVLPEGVARSIARVPTTGGAPLWELARPPSSGPAARVAGRSLRVAPMAPSAWMVTTGGDVPGVPRRFFLMQPAR